MKLDKLDKWHKTKAGLAVFAILELAIADGFFALGIDRGNIWWYVLTLIFLVGTLQNIVHLIWGFSRGKK